MAQTALISVFVVLDSGSSRSWCQQGCFLVRLPSSTCKWCLLSAFAWPFLCAHTRWGRALVCLPLSLQRHQFYWNWAPPLWFHLIEINPEYSLEGLMMKLKLQYFGHLKNWLIRKDPDAGKDYRQEEKGTTEDQMVGWHHWLNGQEFEPTLGDSEGQRSLACCSPRGPKSRTRLSDWPWSWFMISNLTSLHI